MVQPEIQLLGLGKRMGSGLCLVLRLTWWGTSSTWSFLGGSVVKNTAAKVGDSGSIPGSGKSPGEEKDNPLQYSCLGNPKDREAWQAMLHGVTKSWTHLSD